MFERKAIGLMLDSIIDYRGKTPPKSDAGIPCISAANVKNGRLVMSNPSYVSRETYDSWTTRGFPNPGDVIISTEAPAGEVAAFPGDQIYLLTRRVIALQPNPAELDERFLLYALQTKYVKEELHAVARGTTVPRVLKTDITDLKIPLPSLPEQKAIAHILGTLDDKIELNRRMNATLEGMAQALFKSWFVDFDPVIDNALAAGNPIPDQLAPRAKVRKHALANGTTQEESVDHPTLSDPKSLFPAAFQFTEELGWVPEAWEVDGFGHLAQNVREGVDPTTLPAETPYVGLEHIDKQCLSLTRWGTAAEVDSQKSHFKPDDFLFGKLRPYFHKVCHVISEGICSTDILVIRPHQEDDAGYVGCQIFAPEFVEYANLRSTGTRMPRASWKDMAQYEFACPPENLRKAFNDLIRPIRTRCAGAVAANQSLGKLRDTLLPKLISGELRLPVAEKLTEMAQA